MATDKVDQLIEDIKPALAEYDIYYQKFDWKLSRGIEELLYKVTDPELNGLIFNLAQEILSPEVFHRAMENMIKEYSTNSELRDSRMAIWQLIK